MKTITFNFPDNIDEDLLDQIGELLEDILDKEFGVLYNGETELYEKQIEESNAEYEAQYAYAAGYPE